MRAGPGNPRRTDAICARLVKRPSVVCGRSRCYPAKLQFVESDLGVLDTGMAQNRSQQKPDPDHTGPVLRGKSYRWQGKRPGFAGKLAGVQNLFRLIA